MNSSPTQPGPPDPHSPAATPETFVPNRPGYQIILRHLAKLRDGALALRALFETDHAEAATAGGDPGHPAAPSAPEKTPLQRRIERHMSRVDEILIQMRDLNPEHRPRTMLPPEVRQAIETKQRTIHDIVGAELHYWAAAVENAPLDKFDEIERLWIARILRLADLIGVDDEHREHLVFLRDWAAQEHA